MSGTIENGRATNLLTKLTVCSAILLICLVVVAATYFVSFQEFFFSNPPKRDATTRLPVTSMPAFSALYFRFYQYSWILAAIALPWFVYLIVRNGTTLEHIAIFAACITLGCVLMAACALVAIYLCNQTFVFNFQHIR